MSAFLEEVGREAARRRARRGGDGAAKLSAEWCATLTRLAVTAHFGEGEARAPVAKKLKHIVEAAACAVNWAEDVKTAGELEATTWTDEDAAPPRARGGRRRGR